MKALTQFIIPTMLLLSIFGCGASKPVAMDPNIGKIKIEISVETGKDSLARTPDKNVIGRIDKNGVIYDLSGNKIGQRKPSSEELIQQAGF